MFETCPKCNGRKTVGEACSWCDTPDKPKKKPAAKTRKKA